MCFLIMKKERIKKMKVEHRRKSHSGKVTVFLIVSLIILTAALLLFFSSRNTDNFDLFSEESPQIMIKNYADNHGLDYNEYPKKLIELLEKNPETKDFVLSYPKEHNKEHTINMREYKNGSTVPLFMQWDKRWGYIKYSGDLAGFTGCGPVCLSMVAYYLTEDEDMSPDKMIEFAKKNGYALNGITDKGSSWTLISEGGKKLGLDVTELPLDKNRIVKNLEVGNPIICSMGPGDFKTTGHFIVLTGYENGKIRVNDPNSRKNSEKQWEYEDIKDQINNLWAIRK